MKLLPCLLALSAVAACRAPGDSPDGAATVDGQAGADARPTPDADLSEDFCNATDPRTVPVTVVATPEAGETPYLEVLSAAQSTIDVEIYLMGAGGILDQLKAKAGAGVTVRAILDGDHERNTNQQYYDQLVAAGAQVKWSSPAFDYFHVKTFIVDGGTAVISTGNYSKYWSIDRERNFVATDRDPADLADLRALFDADWSGAQATMPCTRMVISPINARDRIMALIQGAQTTLEIESMQFADTAVREAVRARVAAGVTVRVLLADAGWISSNADAATFLHGLGVPVKWIPHLHTKAIVADGAVGYLGSENLSYTSLEHNREVGVIVVEPASVAPLMATFEGDWLVGTDF